MTPNEFYERYGRHIFRVQQQNRRIEYWPYITPTKIENVSLGNTIFLEYGCHFGHISAVYFSAGKISLFPILADIAAISYEFSGCYMAKFRIGNQWYICHIQSGNSPSRTLDFFNFQKNENNAVKDLIVFKPTNTNELIDSWTKKQRDIYQSHCSLNPLQVNRRIQICGLITPNNECYSICMDVETCFPFYIEKKGVLPICFLS